MQIKIHTGMYITNSTRWSKMMKSNRANFSDGQVAAQKKYGTTHAAAALIDPPYNRQDTTKLWPGFSNFIENCPYFFLATSRLSGECNSNFRGGGKGVVFVENDHTLYFPDYTGNGLLHSLGDIFENPKVGLLFINFTHQQRIKVNGRVEIIDEPEELARFNHLHKFVGAPRVLQVNIEYAVLNCARFLETTKEED